MRQTTLVESLLLNRGEYLGQTVLLRATYRLKEVVRVAVVFCPRVPRRGTQQPQGAPPDSDPEVRRSSLTVSAGTRATRKLTSDVLFCFPGLRFDVFSPYRDGRYRSAPKPGKEKQKTYNYRSAVLMVHRFRSSFVCSPRYCVRSGARLRGNWRSSLKHCRLREGYGGPGKPWSPEARMLARYGCVHDLPQPDLR
jgi:hypothetical protein